MANDRPGGSGLTPEPGNGEIELGLNRLRGQSRWAVAEFVKLLQVEGVPGVLVLEKPGVPGDPLEASFLGNLTVDVNQRYRRRPPTR